MLLFSCISARAFFIQGNELRLGPRIGKGRFAFSLSAIDISCSYGDVYQAQWRKITVAVKKLPLEALKNKDFLRDFNQEALIMR